MEAYCVKCHEKREISQPEATFTSSGTPATKGVCPVCGTGLYRMGKTELHEGLEPPADIVRKKKSKKEVKRKGNLVIVESPAKARTIGRILGKDYVVKASVGHVRDLLRSQLSVDVDDNFTPKYRVPNEKRDVVKGLIADSAKVEQVFLATDPDREGEAIAWHLLESAEIEPSRAKRVVFHEITQGAVEEAFGHPRSIDMNLVDAQQARRILDRLVGYNLSPLLWQKVRSRLSAGRVQSVSLRLVVDREREILNFQAQEYWTVDAEFIQEQKPPAFRARLVKIDEEKPVLSSQDEVEKFRTSLLQANYCVSNVKRGERRRKPSAPFTTSTLQQAASQRYGFTARRTMAIAQQLYEGVELGSGDPVGLITYMRTDSTTVSEQALQEARKLISERYGNQFLPEKPVRYRSRSRGAQEAHEAVRPTSVFRTPEKMKPILTGDQQKLYDLIWRRFVASQMKPAVYDTLSLEIEGTDQSHQYGFRVSASALRFPGFLELYGVKDPNKEEPGSEAEELESAMAQLPDVTAGDPVNILDLFPEQHFTQPPPRFSDATLIRAMEEHGIGRPSTYAPTISTLRQRGYIVREQRRLIPTEIGETVNDLLVDHFPGIVDVGFSAEMEAGLDEIASGKRAWVDVIREFYGPFAVQLEEARVSMPEVKAEPEILDRVCPESGHPLQIRHGRFGKFIGCTNFPECRFTEPWLELIGVHCPLDDGDLVERRTRRGRVFYGCSHYPECDFTSWKRPLKPACPNCGGMLIAENRKQASCLNCDTKYDQGTLPQEEGDLA
ncbi:MAG: type I DNA topoisomerase [Anaerolineales bacterium]|nr:MAG: type I DNA topoisomerase [Anaerolineales bacterium]